MNACNGDAGPSGWWIFTAHPSKPGFYLLSTKRWPECFVYMEGGFNGNIRGWTTGVDPGPQGHFKFVPRRDEFGIPDGHYLITNAHWENSWYLYVESGLTGNVSSWSGDPGPQGWFKIMPWNVGAPIKDAPLPKTLAQLPKIKQDGYFLESPSKSMIQQYEGASQAVLEEICLEPTFSEGYEFSKSDRGIAFSVNSSSTFCHKVG